LRALSHSFTSSQIAALTRRERLPARSLNPDQREILRDVVARRAYGVPRGIWARIARILEVIDSSAIGFSAGRGDVKEPVPEDANSIAIHRAVLRNGMGLETVIGTLSEPALASPLGPDALDTEQWVPRKVEALQEPTTRKSVDEELYRNVDLSLGETNVEALVKALSDSGNGTYEVDKALAQRKLTSFLRGCAVREVLEGLTSLYGWRWRRESESRYRISRKKAVKPLHLEQIPAAMHAAIPVDIHAFLRLPDLRDKGPFQSTSIMAEPKVHKAVEKARRSLLSSLWQRPKLKATVLHSELTPEQQRDLALIIFLGQFSGTARILHDDFSIHRIDPDRTVLSLEHGEMLMVDMIIDETSGRNLGFGTNVVRGRK
jgi:hypothetical protein